MDPSGKKRDFETVMVYYTKSEIKKAHLLFRTYQGNNEIKDHA